MTIDYWRTALEFRLLCDLVAGDRLVCITGAGISSSLPQKVSPKQTIPQWPKLLETLFGIFGARLSSQDRRDCVRLLRLDPHLRGKEWPSGRDLILSASILRAVSPAEFDTAFREAVTNEDGSFAETHSILLDMQPAGILTFNYDSAHENAAVAKGAALHSMIPSDESRLRDALVTGVRPFYLKAHGSLDSISELVLTEESYRELMVRSPAYRAFVQNVLTNFNLLFVGFRISDPDFDLFIDSIAHQFGSPLRQHIALFHEKERTVDDIALRRRYGIHLLYVKDFSDIPKILREGMTIPGLELEAHMGLALSASTTERSRAHRHFKTLGKAGRQCALNVLKGRIEEFATAKDYFRLSEIAYSLGVIDADSSKDVLMRLVETAEHADPAGRALTVLREVLKPSDLPQLQVWHDRFLKNPLAGKNADRIPKYLDYLLTYIPAKFSS